MQAWGPLILLAEKLLQNVLGTQPVADGGISPRIEFGVTRQGQFSFSEDGDGLCSLRRTLPTCGFDSVLLASLFPVTALKRLLLSCPVHQSERVK